jgi:cyclase
VGKKVKVWFLKSWLGEEMKIRIIPTILTDGVTVVKGEKFKNWRTVGSAEATARLYANRDVDELLFLDVNARSHGSTINLSLLKHFSNVLDVPFSVGGGINSLDDAKKCFRNGAEKIVLGTAAVLNPQVITQIAELFGNQAVIVAVDFEGDETSNILVKSGSLAISTQAYEFIENLEVLGAGEILLQSVERDGTMSGMDFHRIKQVAKLSNLPVIASGGASSTEDFYTAVENGATAVAAGAIFQFTQVTPKEVSNHLRSKGVRVREF